MINTTTKTVKTRKEHECQICNKPIQKGETAVHYHAFVIRDSEVPTQWHEEYFHISCADENDEQEVTP